ncbi:MAG: ribonuclease III [Oscillospiraceae bacterium]|jgi:ribonuclease-3|nr:ribonuclease III [Oscillospiraceae bacterium]
MAMLEKKIGYNFKNKALLNEALTHSSHSSGKKRISNERLEFLGDSVLSLITSKYLFEQLSDIPEGQLTKLRAGIVCEQSLFGFAQKIDLGNQLFLGRGEENTGGRERRSILADAFEALIAAIYLDGGLTQAEKFVLGFLPKKEKLQSGKPLLSDYKTVLQEIIQQNPEEKITYSLENESGEAHNKIFTSSVLLNNKRIGTGTGRSKKEAEQAAAQEAMRLMGYE